MPTAEPCDIDRRVVLVALTGEGRDRVLAARRLGRLAEAVEGLR